MRELTVKVHEVATDGLPDMDEMTGRVAFIFDGCLVSGWPLGSDGMLWEANSDVGQNVAFADVTHWVEWPEPVWETASDKSTTTGGTHG